jgi:GH25 family lysozyme M1 (1,4-beta-N-acetylmuramidase)
MNYQGITGFDVSKWQGTIDFQKMKGGGASFVILKASQGNWPDPMFAENWAKAKGVLPRATYHYYDNRYPPKEQARKYFDIIRGDLEGMCWLDLEDKSAGMYAGWRNWFDFCEELKLLYPGVKIGIYSGFFYMAEMLSYAKPIERNYFAQYPLWQAWYFPADPFHPKYETILIPLPWLEYLILQSGTPSIGRDAGVESEEIDYNQFNGDTNKFAKYFGGELPQSEPEEPMIQWYRVNASALNIREGAGVSYEIVGKLIAGDLIEAAGEPLGGWVKITGILRDGTSVLFPAEAWCHSGYCVKIPAPPPQPVEYPQRVMLEFEGGVTKWYVAE